MIAGHGVSFSYYILTAFLFYFPSFFWLLFLLFIVCALYVVLIVPILMYEMLSIPRLV